MKKIMCLLILAGWGLAGGKPQNVVPAAAQTNTPPATPQPSVTLHAPPARKARVFGTNVQTGGFLVKVAKGKQPLQAINPFAPLPAPHKYLDVSLDPMPVEHHGLVLFWLSY
jgi:hypothetical protein